MLECQFTINGISPYGQSQAVVSKKDTGEGHDAFEERTWREKMHLDEAGEMLIPGNAFKNMMTDVARHLAETIPGKGKATFTKHFKSGLLVLDNSPLGIKGADVEPIYVFLPNPSGMGTRTWKHFPVVPQWRASNTFHIFDPILEDKPEKVEEYLSFAGKFIGLGYWRAQNGGQYGRFVVESFTSSKV